MPKKKKRWKFISKLKSLRKAAEFLADYLDQQLFGTEVPILAVDVETFRPDGDRSKFPNAYWDGEQWEGRISMIQIGTDPDLDFGDRQIIIDVKVLGEKLVAKYLKPLLSRAPWLTQEGKYEWQFITKQLGIKPLAVIDTKILSQVFFSGDRLKHDLSNVYANFMSIYCPGLFEEYTGCSFGGYEKKKKVLQKSDWSQRPLTFEQKDYGADDVRIIFPCYGAICEAIERWILREEKNLPENRGTAAVISLELSLLPMFAKMEQEGIKFDSEYYWNKVIPLMESERDKAYKLCTKFKKLLWKDKDGSSRAVFQAKEVKTEDVARAQKLITVIFGSKIARVRRKTTTSKAGISVEIKWIGPAIDRVVGVLKSILTEEKGYFLQESELINLRSPDLKYVLSEIVGFTVHNCKEKYLKNLYDPTNPRTEVIKCLMWYRKNAGYCSRYGRNVLNRVSKNGFIRPHWHQIGSEKSEVVSGRSSASDPPIMQMAGRAILYRYSKNDQGISAAELLRSAYIAEPGCIFTDADYSQIEPRITAELTGDKLLQKIYLKNIDLYDVTAQIIFEDEYAAPINPPEGLSKKGIEKWLRSLTPEQKKQKETAKHQRDISKIIRLGTTYGMGYKSLYRHILDERPDWQVYDRKRKKYRPGEEDDVKAILERLNDSHPGVVEFIDRTEYEATKKLRQAGSLAEFRAKKNKGRKPFGIVRSMFGRHRRFCILPDHDRDETDPRGFSEEELHKDYNPTDRRYYYGEFKKRCNKVRLAGFNHRIQATSADITKFAELYIYRWLEERIELDGWDKRLNRIVLILHDEVLVQCEEQYAQVVKAKVEELMLKAGRKFLKKIPVLVSIGQGQNWHEAGNVEKSKVQAKSMNIYKKKKHAA